MAYADLLKHPFWQKKRLDILNRDNFCCTQCTDNLSNLQIHHLYYNLSLMPWEYPDEALVTLCDTCHEKAEFLKWLWKVGVRQLVQQGYIRSDVKEIADIIQRRVNSNMHRESVVQYMSDIKNLINGTTKKE